MMTLFWKGAHAEHESIQIRRQKWSEKAIPPLWRNGRYTCLCPRPPLELRHHGSAPHHFNALRATLADSCSLIVATSASSDENRERRRKERQSMGHGGGVRRRRRKWEKQKKEKEKKKNKWMGNSPCQVPIRGCFNFSKFHVNLYFS